MGHIDVSGVSYFLPDGRPLLGNVSFRVGEGSLTALVGPNGSGKTTLLAMIEAAGAAMAGSGRSEPARGPVPDEGSISVSGSLGVMAQFIGSIRDATSVRELLVSVAPLPLRRAAAELARAEREMTERGDEPSQLAYAQALSDWGDLGGYETEVLWDSSTTAALGLGMSRAGGRPVGSLSGGEQKRLVLHALLASPARVLLLDEPDNYLDVPGKEWLEASLSRAGKTILFISHDRELLARSATGVVTLEPTPAGSTAWVHGSSYATYHQARAERLSRLEELHKAFDAEHGRLKALVAEMRRKAAYNSDFASKLTNAQHRLRRFEEAGPPEAIPRCQRISMRLVGGRTGKRALACAGLCLSGLTDQFDLEVLHGERVAFLGPNGTGKSRFFRLIAGREEPHSGTFWLGARVTPGHFAQSYEHPELAGRAIAEILQKDFDLPLERAVASLGRYELSRSRDQLYETLSGGQQARLQILLLELSGATLLVLDEPTDNLDVESAEALEAGLAGYEGTVLAVTHDRYFARSFDRFFLFGADGRVVETPGPVFDEGRLERAAATRLRRS
ncbi:MAG: ABC-F family ATP-binding cassette domain-containing protein [Acidimicrobiales bacterium]